MIKIEERKYFFQHKSDGRSYTGTQKAMCTNYNLSEKGIEILCRGDTDNYLGWKCIGYLSASLG